MVFLFITGNGIHSIWIFSVTFINIFAYFILNIKLYKHHYLSGGIMFLVAMIFNILDFYKLSINGVLILLLTIFIEAIYSLCIIVNKYSMDYKYSIPYEISFYQGLFSLILNTLLLMIFSYIKCIIILNY